MSIPNSPRPSVGGAAASDQQAAPVNRLSRLTHSSAPSSNRSSWINFRSPSVASANIPKKVAEQIAITDTLLLNAAHKDSRIVVENGGASEVSCSVYKDALRNLETVFAKQCISAFLSGECAILAKGDHSALKVMRTYVDDENIKLPEPKRPKFIEGIEVCVVYPFDFMAKLRIPPNGSITVKDKDANAKTPAVYLRRAPNYIDMLEMVYVTNAIASHGSGAPVAETRTIIINLVNYVDSYAHGKLEIHETDPDRFEFTELGLIPTYIDMMASLITSCSNLQHIIDADKEAERPTADDAIWRNRDRYVACMRAMITKVKFEEDLSEEKKRHYHEYTGRDWNKDVPEDHRRG